jgi:hypothetical protein
MGEDGMPMPTYRDRTRLGPVLDSRIDAKES